MRAAGIALIVVAACAWAGCSNTAPQGPTNPGARSSSDPAVTTDIVSVSSTSQLGDMVMWNLRNKTDQPQLVTCEVLVLDASTQLGELGPLQLAVAAGATAEQYSEVTTLAGSGAGDAAQVLCQKGPTSSAG